LELWDELGIPHKEKKQVFGSPLTIIGFEVNPNTMTITLPEKAKLDLIRDIEIWIDKPRKGSHNEGKFKISRWQSFTGWFNWALNVFPWLRPALNRVYPKMSGRGSLSSKAWINNTIRYDLSWALHHLRSLPGTHIISNLKWDPSEADVTIHVDACLEGMGFWYADEPVGFYSPVSTTTPSNHIFYFEALCALSALIHAVSHRPCVSRIVIYSDSSNTVDIFSSFRSEPTFNHLLLTASDVPMKHHVDLRVLHIPGAENVIADAISRLHISSILDIMPDFQLSYFQPPRFPLGALQN
jgi:hypothetical protein